MGLRDEDPVKVFQLVLDIYWIGDRARHLSSQRIAMAQTQA